MLVALVLTLLGLLLLIGLPVAFAMAVSGAIGLWLFGGMPILMGILSTTSLSTSNSYELITIPMFILMAEFVIISGVAQDLFRSATIWVGRIRGGVAMATALAGAGFGAICGSSTASAATLASTSLPEMLRQGYEPKLAGGVVAISGTLAMLIPPSVALILYGILADVSISRLMIAGIIPGIIVTIAIILTVYILVQLWPHSAPPGQIYSLREKLTSTRRIWPMLLLFISVTGTIYSGIATPTEASGLAAFIAMLLAMWERQLTWPRLWLALRHSAQTTCMILFIILGAHIFGYFFTLTRVTNDLATWVGALPYSPLTIMTFILMFYIVLGFFMDQIAILILTVPVALPVVLQLGYDPIWFGVIVVVTAELGMVTPPLGMNVFVVARYTRRPMGELFRGVLPHVWAHLIVIALLTLFPQLVLWLPSTMSAQ